MAHGPRYRVPYRRRREGKTDYRKRLRLLLSRKPRFVVRGTLCNIICQGVLYDYVNHGSDIVIVTVHSKVLERDFGWKGYRGNIPTAYLTGLLAGLKCIKYGIFEAVLDLGRQVPHKGGRLFAALLGALDAGMKIPHGEGIFPTPERLRGEHIANYAKLLKETDSEKFQKQFGGYLKRGFDPEKLPEHFEEIKQKIIEKYKDIYELGQKLKNEEISYEEALQYLKQKYPSKKLNKVIEVYWARKIPQVQVQTIK